MSTWRHSFQRLCIEQPQALPLFSHFLENKDITEAERFARRACDLTTRVWPCLPAPAETPPPRLHMRELVFEPTTTNLILLPGGRWLLAQCVDTEDHDYGRMFYFDLESRNGRDGTDILDRLRLKRSREKTSKALLLERFEHPNYPLFEQMLACEVKSSQGKQFDIARVYMPRKDDDGKLFNSSWPTLLLLIVQKM